VRKIRDDEAKIRDHVAKLGTRAAGAAKNRPPAFPQIEEAVVSLLSMARTTGLPVTRETVQRFGVKAAQRLLDDGKLPNEARLKLGTFNASERWAKNVVQRHGMKSVTLHGEGGSVDVAAIAAGIERLRSTLRDYDPENIYNVDETGLFYKLLPKRTYLSPHEDRKTARGTKGMKAKDRITAFICTNASGKQKLPLSVIGSSKNPRCFGKKSKPVRNATNTQFSACLQRLLVFLVLHFVLYCCRCTTSTRPRLGRTSVSLGCGSSKSSSLMCAASPATRWCSSWTTVQGTARSRTQGGRCPL
jgi:hypothetical protein